MRWGGAGSTRGRIGWLTALVIGLVVGLSASAASAAGWTSPSKVDPLLHLNAVSCGSRTDCAVVGGPYGSTEAASYDGTSWSAPATIDTSGDLYAVSCAPGATTFCLALDDGGAAWTFDGHSWTDAPTAPGGAASKRVSCVSSSFCVTVDANGRSSTYDGSSWSAFVDIEPFSVNGQSVPTGISCASTSLCVAVDNGGNAFTYNGNTWSSADQIDPGRRLAAVSCASSTMCVATDTSGGALTYGSGTWSGPVAVVGGAGLTALSCPSVSFCLAIDSQGDGFIDSNGSWGSALTLDPLGSGLTGVSCTSSTFCLLVDGTGTVTTFTGDPNALDGVALGGGGLTSVSCPSSSFCAAVDWNGRALIYNGSVWSQPTPIEPSGLGLAAISCPSASFCAAVDVSGDAVTYNGSAWDGGTFFDPGGAPDSISCPASTYCVAVDQQGDALTWSGGHWSAATDVDSSRALLSVSCPTTSFCAAVDSAGYVIIDHAGSWSAPAIVDSVDGLTAVSCGSASSCFAVGGSAAWAYNGNSWRQVGGSYGAAESLSCPSANFCTALDDIGFVYTADGNAWQNPNQQPDDPAWLFQSTLTPAVGCASAAFCVAVDDVGQALTYTASIPAAPVNSGDPSISGVAKQGQTLSESNGAWANNPTSYAYQWEDCDTTGANCIPIAGATSPFYTLGASDIGATVRVEESAFNFGGTGGPVASAATATVLPPGPPVNTSRPTVAGSMIVGQVLTASQGSWSNSPTSFAYQWLSCTGVSSCAAIAGATTSTYRLTTAEIGRGIAVQVQATNAAGSSTASSFPFFAVGAPPRAPADIDPPVVYGLPIVGARVSVLPGLWGIGNIAFLPSPYTFTYQWQRCGHICADIPGATAATYTTTTVDVGTLLQAVVTATDRRYSVPVSGEDTSDQFGPIAPESATVRAALNGLAAPSRRAARIPLLLKAGRYGTRFSAPTAGKLVIAWYVNLSRHGRRVEIGHAVVVFHSAHAARVWVVLTRAGRQLLRAASHTIGVRSTITFFPFGRALGAAARQQSFTLRR